MGQTCSRRSAAPVEEEWVLISEVPLILSDQVPLLEEVQKGEEDGENKEKERYRITVSMFKAKHPKQIHINIYVKYLKM